MGIVHWLRSLGKNKPEIEENRITTRDLLDFMDKQQQRNNEIVKTVLEHSAQQNMIMQTYIDLFKPREIKSTTLGEREAMKEGETKIRPSEWMGIKNLNEFNELTSGISFKGEDY